MNKPITVLYVEDDEDIRDVSELALEGDEFVLLSCCSGNEALEKAALSDPDLLLLDVMMPDMDGPTTLENLRKLPHLSKTPAIFMTAKVQASDVKTYRECGAIGVISKPFDPMMLSQQIISIMKRGGL